MAKPDRPVAVLVIAIFHFIVGGWGLLNGLCGGVIILIAVALFNIFIGELRRKDPQAAQLFQGFFNGFTDIPGLVPYFVGSLLLGLVLAVILVVAGFGLLKMRPWARRVSIVYAGLAIPLGLLSGIYSLTVLMPGMEKANQEFLIQVQQYEKAKGRPGPPPPTNPLMGNSLANYFGTILGMVLSSVYPTAVLIVMFLPKVRKAFARQGTPADPYQGQGDREDDFADYDRHGHEEKEF